VIDMTCCGDDEMFFYAVLSLRGHPERSEDLTQGD
jgi:hypothetical protein